MGILKSLFTLGKSVLSQAEESIEEAQGVRMLEQHIRDAKGELEKVENHQHATWDVHNFTMGYQRQVTDDTWEYLLLNGEESFNEQGEPEWVFSRALGVDIPLTSLNVIG